MVLLFGPRRKQFLTSEVPLYQPEAIGGLVFKAHTDFFVSLNSRLKIHKEA